MRRALRIGLVTLLWFALWLLLVEKLEADELIVGAACALLAGAATEVTWGVHLTAFSGSPRRLAQAWRLPWLFAIGSVEIFEVLARQLFTRRAAESLLLTARFDAGREDDPDAAVRRALAVGYTTMTPNFVVLGIDRERRTLLYHQIAKSEIPKMTRNLGAKP